MSDENSLKDNIVVNDEGNNNTEETTPELEEFKDHDVPNNNISQSNSVDESIQPQNTDLVTGSVKIQFSDLLEADLYKSVFLKFIKTFPEFQIHYTSDLEIDVHRDKNVTPNNDIDLAFEKSPSLPKKAKKHSKVKKELFIVDATPSETPFQNKLKYTTKFTVGSEETKETFQNHKSGCFNCGEQHPLKDCPQPKDVARIALARQNFKLKAQSKTSRYHVDDEKYSHLQPGKISKNLTQALGLQKNELPHYIYLMRRLGYPPGWLEEAKFVNSNLDIFGIGGKNVKSTSLEKVGLDEDKIIEYPGFNVPPEEGVNDDYRIFKVPPYTENFSKKAMLCFFQTNILQKKDNFETCDMDIDTSDTVKEDEPPKVNRTSPSLVDLEEQKLQLLEQLDEENQTVKNEFESDSDKGFLAIKTSCYGTPLLKSTSPYSRLPNPEKFSKDVTPVINFENLPNSTGKYEQLTDVLQKVRDTLKKTST